MLDLRFQTPPEWLDAVFEDFDAFLLDHANCERKASATGLSFVARYPDRKELLDPMIEFAKEELEHFHVMYRICAARGLTLADDYKDPYVNALRSQVRAGGDAHLLDRLLVSGVVEARGCERLFMVAEALRERDPVLFEPYMMLARAESRHHAFFFRMARLYFTEEEVKARGADFLDFEADLVRRLPHRAAVH
jgi:tRNA 2-(methylsulfanyl)-N6-isopentenyladenosine37 hydroxylase